MAVDFCSVFCGTILTRSCCRCSASYTHGPLEPRSFWLARFSLTRLSGQVFCHDTLKKSVYKAAILQHSLSKLALARLHPHIPRQFPLPPPRAVFLVAATPPAYPSVCCSVMLPSHSRHTPALFFLTRVRPHKPRDIPDNISIRLPLATAKSVCVVGEAHFHSPIRGNVASAAQTSLHRR